MKQIIILLLCCITSITLPAQSYKILWSEVKKNVATDKPRSALQGVKKIMTKASSEHNHNELLKAWISQYYLQKDISPDSARLYVLPMFEKALLQETDTVRAAFFHSALGICYLSDANNYHVDKLTRDDLKQKADTHFRASLAHPEALAHARTDDFLPLLSYGKESRWYAHDVLHILFDTYIERTRMDDKERTKWADKLIAIYRSLDRQEAVLHLSLKKWIWLYRHHNVEDMLENDEAYLCLNKLFNEFQHLNANILTCNEMVSLQHFYKANENFSAHNDSLLYHFAQKALNRYSRQRETNVNELTNFLKRITAPSARLSGLTYASLYPEKNYTLKISARNAQRVVVRVTPLTKSRIKLSNSSHDDIEKMLSTNKHNAKEYVSTFDSVKPYAWTDKNIMLTAPNECGMYMIELLIDGKRISSHRTGVSRLTAISLSTKAEGLRLTVVDRQTGHPVPHAKIVGYKSLRRGKGMQYVQQEVMKTNERGQTTVDHRINNYTCLALSFEGDEAAELFTDYLFQGERGNDATQRAFTRINLFTDRSVYRPGQKVQFAGVEFTQQDDNSHVEAYKKLHIKLLNAQQKCIDSLSVTTDEYGSFSGVFSLPKVCLNGVFHLKAMSGRDNEEVEFRVEEYKRPTFTALPLPLTTYYALGDSIKVEGQALTYSQTAVSGARVAFSVERSSHPYMYDDNYKTQTGETFTDSNGHFSLPVLLTRPKSEPSVYRNFFFNVKYIVTAENGETAEGQTTITVGTKPSKLVIDLPLTMCRKKGKQLPPITPLLVNAVGKNLEGKGTYRIFKSDKTLDEGTFNANEKLHIDAFNHLPQGEYSIAFTTEKTTVDTLTFTIFNESDTRLTGISTPLFCHEEKTTEGINVFYSSGVENAIVFADIVGNEAILKSCQDTLNGQLRHISLNYKDEYRDGIKLVLCVVYNDKIYQHTATIEKPQPDKRLFLKWTSFRSQLTPGSKEEWKMKITQRNGKPAKAQLMACLYDASLNDIYKHEWDNFGLNFNRKLPLAKLRFYNNNASFSLSGEKAFKRLPVFFPTFTTWNKSLFDGAMTHTSRATLNGIKIRGRNGAKNANAITYKASYALSEAKTNATETAVNMDFAAKENAAPQAAMGTPYSKSATPTVRKNFAETAFFRPNLLTDEKGEVAISFTLPESTTQWNFEALAHDCHMNNGHLDTTIVARKDFMVMPSLPRFLREGDIATIPVNVTNLTSQTQHTTVTIDITDNETGKLIFKSKKHIDVETGKTMVCTFQLNTKGIDGLLVCRTVAETEHFSDGEEHYIPVLSKQTEVVRSMPFSLTEKGTFSWQTDTLFYDAKATHKQLTIETVSNPTWLAAMALPTLAATNDALCAYDWSTRLYAIAVGNNLVKNNPSLLKAAHYSKEELQKMADTKAENFSESMPWCRQAEEIRQQAKSLAEMADDAVAQLHIRTATDKLNDLQNADGAFAWYPGMRGNAYTTLYVATLLARLEQITDFNAAHPMLAKALSFLQKEASRKINHMKQQEKAWGKNICPDQWMMDYAYLNCIAHTPINNHTQFIIERAYQLHNLLSIHNKATLAVVMARTNKKQQAQTLIESLIEHTSCDIHGARFFDNQQARSRYSSQCISTQCDAIEALKLTGHEKEAEEMTLWLMIAKRTQMWETSMASTNAIHTLLTTASKEKELKDIKGGKLATLEENSPLLFTLFNNDKIVAVSAPSENTTPHTTGYYRETLNTLETVEATSIKLHKQNDGLSWGCIYASFMTDKVETKHSEMDIQRRFELLDENAWIPIENNNDRTLRKGDIVRQTFCIRADADYDFVVLKANHPSCLTPRRALSGFSQKSNLATYKAVDDELINFFIEKLPKGEHRFYEEYVVEKEGLFNTGTASIKCVYAPEFNAQTKSTQITVKQLPRNDK